jgi:hypothetical protein
MDCEMEFHYYPADTQSCVFKIRSCKFQLPSAIPDDSSNNKSNLIYTCTDSYTTKDVNVTWDEGPFLLERSEPNYDVKLDIMESEDLVESKGLVDDSYS